MKISVAIKKYETNFCISPGKSCEYSHQHTAVSAEQKGKCSSTEYLAEFSRQPIGEINQQVKILDPGLRITNLSVLKT